MIVKLASNRLVPLSSDVRSKLDPWLTRYPEDQKQSGVLHALQLVQEENGGWITTALMDSVADYLGMAKVSVYEVASFYSMLETEPVGRHMVAICTNISCMLRGSDDIVGHIEQKLGIKLGETTSDGRITLKMEEECLAACCGAPMMAVNGHYHENLTTENVDAILDGLE